MLLSRIVATAAAMTIAAVSGCSCGEPASGAAAAGGAGGAALGGRGGASGGSGSATTAAGGSGAGGAGAGSPGACKMVRRPDHVPESFTPLNALGCECTFWLGTDKASLPTMTWAPCGDGVLAGLACERISVSGFGAEWAHFAAVGSDTDREGAPLAALAVFRDFVSDKAALHWLWLDMTSLTAVAALASDRAVGTCIAQAPGLAPGVLLLNINQARERQKDGGGIAFTGNSGFARLGVGTDGAIVYTASEPFQGDSHYTPTTKDVYGRLLDDASAGIYRAAGNVPRGELLDLSPFTSAFPESSLGADFILSLSDADYIGTGIYNPTIGFRPLLPPSQAKEQAAFNLGGDGGVYVWTSAQGRDANGLYANNEVYTAPVATSAEQIASTKRRLAKADGGYANSPWAVGCGYAAQRWEKSVLVVRLSDGARWRAVDGVVQTNLSPRAITCEHIYGVLDTLELGRIRLDKLGPPLPAE